MSMLSSLFGGGGQTPADAARPYYDKIIPMEQGNYNPYMEQGQQAGNTLTDQFGQLANDPGAKYNDLMSGYNETPGFQQHRKESLQAAQNSAAAGGERGTQDDQVFQARLANSLSNEDMQNYYKNVSGLYGTGLQGEQGLYNTGYDATKSLTSDTANVYGQQGQLAYNSQAEHDKRKQDLLGSLIKAGGTIAGGFLGGPAGAVIANKFI